MANLFGDNVLFSEFEKDRPACDKILKLSCDDHDILRKIQKSVTSKHVADEATFDNIQNETAYGQAEEDRGSGDTNADYIKKLENEVERLKSLNAKLIAVNRLITPKRIFENLKLGPCIQINYMNHAVARRYKAEIEDYLATKLEEEEEVSKQADNRLPVLPLRPNYVSLGKQANEDFGSAADFNTVIGSCHYYDWFIIDCIGWPLVEYNPLLSDGWVIPVYEQVFLDPLPYDEVEEVSQEVKRDKRPKRSCFNCGGDHSLNVCKEPRNQKRIAENRSQFQQQCPSTASPQLKQSRYHADDEPQFVGLKAGTISENLRSALGLSVNQLPPYIYQMRIFGYPPGYLEEAMKDTSGLSMFGKHGLEIRKDGNSLEDGEVNEDKSPLMEYDVNKFVSYPGFNVEPSPDTIDEHARFNMPPMQPRHHVDAMKRNYSTKVKQTECGTKRQHSEQSGNDSGPVKIKRVDKEVISEDMDLEEPDKLDTLEIQKTFNEAEGDCNIVSSTLSLSYSSKQGVSVGGNGDEANAACQFTPVAATPISRCGSVGYTLGTPLAFDVSEDGTENDSSITKLPDRSSFSVGVSDHILYENLPNATGTFQRLRGVIRTLREGGASIRHRDNSPHSATTPSNPPQS